MKKATRKFLQDKKSSKYPSKLVDVLQLAVPNAKPNRSYQNAALLCDADEKYVIQSGWLVGDYLGALGTAIIPHYWIIDKETMISYDVTPRDDGQDYEYVLDIAVLEFSSDRFLLPPCLTLLDDGAYLLVLGDDKSLSLDTIDVKLLYTLQEEHH